MHSLCRQICVQIGILKGMKPDSRAPNVRISANSHELLRRLAEEEGESMHAILDKAIDRYRRERFLRSANEDYQALNASPASWQQELQERACWDQTLADGLDKK